VIFNNIPLARGRGSWQAMQTGRCSQAFLLAYRQLKWCN
jgi:hypothetical protein